MVYRSEVVVLVCIRMDDDGNILNIGYAVSWLQ